MTAIAGTAPARTEEEAITRAWQVWRRAQETDWPEPGVPALRRACWDLFTALQVHACHRDEPGYGDLRVLYAAETGVAVEAVVLAVTRHCGQKAAAYVSTGRDQ